MFFSRNVIQYIPAVWKHECHAASSFCCKFNFKSRQQWTTAKKNRRTTPLYNNNKVHTDDNNSRFSVMVDVRCCKRLVLLHRELIVQHYGSFHRDTSSAGGTRQYMYSRAAWWWRCWSSRQPEVHYKALLKQGNHPVGGGTVEMYREEKSHQESKVGRERMLTGPTILNSVQRISVQRFQRKNHRICRRLFSGHTGWWVYDFQYAISHSGYSSPSPST